MSPVPSFSHDLVRGSIKNFPAFGRFHSYLRPRVVGPDDSLEDNVLSLSTTGIVPLDCSDPIWRGETAPKNASTGRKTTFEGCPQKKRNTS